MAASSGAAWSGAARPCGVRDISVERAATWHNRSAVSDRFATVELLARRAEQLAAGDPQATRLVYAIVIGLVIVGVVLLVIAIWMLRRTKADMELLGPLERMSDSKWRTSNPDARRALLDEVRPDGAVVPIPVLEVAASGAVLPPPTLPESDPVVESEPVIESDPAAADLVGAAA